MSKSVSQLSIINYQLSIITVTFNAANWIDRTIDSISSQTARNRIEYIVIDGASTDKTVEILQNRGRGIDIYISEPDKGLYDAMNKGLRQASGEYVWFMNAGDTLYNSTVCEQLLALVESKQHPDILYGETALVDSSGLFLRMRRLKAPDKLTWKSFQNGMMVCHQSFIVKRSIAPRYDLSYRLSSDQDWCIRSLKAAQTIVNSRLIITNYLEEGLSTANLTKSLKERYAIQCRHYGVLSTALHHLWFAFRFLYAKHIRRNV